MDHRKEHLIKKIQAIQDEDTLARILHFVEEDALVYESASTEEFLEDWQIKELGDALQQYKDGNCVSVDVAKAKIAAIQ
jgi:hypothetical protein